MGHLKQMTIWFFFDGIYLGSWVCWLPSVLVHQPTPLRLAAPGVDDAIGARDYLDLRHPGRKINAQWITMLALILSQVDRPFFQKRASVRLWWNIHA